MYGSPVGTRVMTSDGELIAAGDIIRVFNIHVVASGTTAPVATLKNGGISGTTFIKQTGVASTGTTFDYGVNGVLFTNGCYVAQLPTDGTVLINFRKDLA